MSVAKLNDVNGLPALPERGQNEFEVIAVSAKAGLNIRKHLVSSLCVNNERINV